MSASKDEGKGGSGAPFAAVLSDTLAPEPGFNTLDASRIALGQTLPEHPPGAVLGATLGPESTLAPEQGQSLRGAGEEAVVSISLNESSLSGLRGEFPVQRWDRYEFLQLLGQGGMGAVYKARDKRLGRIVALKFIRGGDPNMIMRFLQEARAQARIDHPNVCKVYEVGEVEGKAYIAMQFVDGKALDGAAATLTLSEKVFIMRQIAEAMHHSHRLGIIHRDLKPANILLERAEDGSYNPVVMDFGLAREASDNRGLTETGAVMGTPAYMAPEQARGETRDMDRRCDVYSLGATLYDLICGVPPFDAGSVVEILLQVVNEDPVPLRTRKPSVPVDLETIVMKCLNKEPSQRYDSAKMLADDLAHYLNGEPIVGKRLSLLTRAHLRARKQRALFAVSALSLLVVCGMGVSALRQYVVNKREQQRIEERARVEQELARQLGEEITKMEWLLRSARQMPLHNLEREKNIIRERMGRLDRNLKTRGDFGLGLAHYALGRGHMALHEYPQALAQLSQAVQFDKTSADIHYALGFVLGKHFEQAMYEARLSGGGDWAKKQLKEIEPKYLRPAIDSLQRSRTMKSDAPQYLEALIAYYREDYDAALKLAQDAQQAAPWLYEASKLSGDVHLVLALRARDHGRYEDAEKNFVAAAESFSAAAAIGQSDGEVYEGLAETWVRRIEMALQRGQPPDAAYAAAIAAADKVTVVEPESIEGPLKKAFASLMTMDIIGAGVSSEERIKQCIACTEAVLKKQPDNPYARDVAAGCNAMAAERALSQGKDPEPLLSNAQTLLEPAIKQFPHFLWGLGDLAIVKLNLGKLYLSRGNPLAKDMLQDSIDAEMNAVYLDATYLNAYQNMLSTRERLIFYTGSEQALQKLLSHADTDFKNCITINSQYQQCYINYFTVYSRAAHRAFLLGKDPQSILDTSYKNLEVAKKMGGSFLDLEQYSALAYSVDAQNHVRKHENPEAVLKQLDDAIGRCLAINAQDAMCRTQAARAAWIRGDWLQQSGKPPLPALQLALTKAIQAKESLEPYPDAWQVLAETYYRLLQTGIGSARLRAQYLAAGLSAAQKALAINPNHPQALATHGALELLGAQLQRDPALRQSLAKSALMTLERGLKQEPLLMNEYTAVLAQAKELARAADL